MTTPNADYVLVGSRWRGITGNVMVVLEVDGLSARLGYVNDPEDSFWEERDDVAAYLTFVAPAHIDGLGAPDA